ncbi:MAG: hypothetical protein Q9228_008031, partial [Teloschistes exilis]
QEESVTQKRRCFTGPAQLLTDYSADVVITYNPVSDEARPTKFESSVAYIKQSQPDDAAPST